MCDICPEDPQEYNRSSGDPNLKVQQISAILTGLVLQCVKTLSPRHYGINVLLHDADDLLDLGLDLLGLLVTLGLWGSAIVTASDGVVVNVGVTPVWEEAEKGG